MSNVVGCRLFKFEWTARGEIYDASVEIVKQTAKRYYFDKFATTFEGQRRHISKNEVGLVTIQGASSGFYFEREEALRELRAKILTCIEANEKHIREMKALVAKMSADIPAADVVKRIRGEKV